MSVLGQLVGVFLGYRGDDDDADAIKKESRALPYDQHIVPHDPPLLPYLLLSEEEDDASRSRFSLFFRSMDPAKSVWSAALEGSQGYCS